MRERQRQRQQEPGRADRDVAPWVRQACGGASDAPAGCTRGQGGEQQQDEHVEALAEAVVALAADQAELPQRGGDREERGGEQGGCERP